MRVQPRGEDRLAALGDAPRHRDRLPARGRAVIHAGVGDVGAEQPRDLRLELEQHLQRALRDFGLVGRVGGEELAALDQVINAGRHMVAIRAGAEEERHVAGDGVLAREGGKMPLDREFAGVVRQVADRAIEACGFGHVDEQVVDRGRADGCEHRGAVVGGEGQVTHDDFPKSSPQRRLGSQAAGAGVMVPPRHEMPALTFGRPPGRWHDV